MSLSTTDIIKEQYINNLKNLLIENDNSTSNTNNEIIDEDFYEWEIDDFENFIDNADDMESPEFNICKHKWNLLLYSYFGSFIIYLQNKDIKNYNDNICTKLIFSFRNYKDPSRYKTFISSIYCFSNTNYDYYSGYKNEIYEDQYIELIKPLIEDNKIAIGVYIQVYKNNKIENYLNNLRNLIKDEDDYYDVKGENYYEWAIENWGEIEKSSGLSPNFNIDGHEWKISLYLNEAGFVKIELDNFNSYRLKDNEYFYINYTFVIRNSNDFACYKAKSSTSLKRFSKKEDKIVVEKFIESKDLYNKDEDTNKSLVEYNKAVLGVYIRIYDSEQKVNKKLTNLLKSLIKPEENYKIKEENYFEWRIDDWEKLKNCWEYSPEFNIGGYEWYIRLNPNYNDFVHLRLEIRYSFNSKENESVYANCVLVIHNISDISCFEAKVSSTMKAFNYNDWSIDFSKFIKRENLYINKDNSDKPLVQNNKIAIGAYVRVYEKL
ncbi:hypothetical protein H8356DRAFT_1289411 [Neocallimastix lanati (nom. inval.)]|nr:hypothetical protein H8356DRAFT_1289411 [Neocallimastix sp. JGI-2020a]